MFLILSTVCQNSNFLKVIYYVKLSLRVVFFVIPIILIFKLILDVYKNIISGNNDEIKNNNKKMATRIIATIIMFFVYPIINLIFSLDVINQVGYLECWNNATTISEIDSYNKSIILDVNPSEIEGSTTLECFSTTGCELKLPEAKRNNFDFLGWSTTKECDSIVNSDYYVTTTSTRLYACFKVQENAIPKANLNNNTSKTPSKTIFVGDSRTEDMCSYLKSSMGSNESCVASSGKSLSWFNSTAVPKINSILNSDKDTVYNIVIDLGVNGLSSSGEANYANTYNGLKSGAWSKHNIVVVSVTPVNESKFSKSYKQKNFNSKIKSFNNNLKSNLSSNIKYCDIYDSVLSLVSSSKNIEKDGLHYKKSGYESIYKLKKNCLG